MLKKFGLPAVAALVVAALYYYIAIPVINIKSASFWVFLAFIIAAYIFFMLVFSGKLLLSDLLNTMSPTRNKKSTRSKVFSKKAVKRTIIILVAIAICAGIIIFLTSSPVTRASSYQQMLTVTESNFNEDIAELPLSQIPVVDRGTAERLGSRKIGEVVELVSQFNVSTYYTQINFNNTPVRVSPLEYADLFKWFANKDEGIPYYVKIDMATQDTELVHLDNGMKYSPSEYFSRDLMRHIRFAYPTKMIDSVSFEIDDNGAPYWIISCYDYTIGFLGGYDISGVITVNAVDGTMEYFDVADEPQWIDCVYEADVVLRQANYWGAYKNGFLNSIVSQKNVVKTTEGYNYLAINDDIWAYTGITSVVADESNIGFILINLRTKEAKTYSINGAEEYSAMESAQGKIQEKNYIATFPILVNIADTPSYFISLKDSAGLVKAYSFVSVSDYQIVGVADTLPDAESEYRRLLKEAGKLTTPEIDIESTINVTANIAAVSPIVKDGNTYFYIKFENDENIYIADVALNDELPFVAVGDKITVTYIADDDGINVTAVEVA